MPQLTSSFASAAAGQNPRGAGRSDSARGSGSGECNSRTSRSISAEPCDRPRSNGTRTFRRASTTPFSQSAAASPADASQPAGTDFPSMSSQSLSSAYDSPSGFRYTKEELLDIYKNDFEPSQINPSDLFEPTWNPSQMNGSHPRPWGKTSDSPHVPQDPSVCWDSHGTVKPISFEEMSAEEREMFATDVNSTMKPPQQNKDGNHAGAGGINGRKTSVSVGNAANYQTSSPSATSRPGTRRRETTDTNPFPTASPTANRSTRDESWLPHRSTDLKGTISDEPEDDSNARDATPARNQPISLPRSNTTGTSGFGGQGSLWGPTPGAGTTSSIGSFGNFALPTPSIGDKRFGTGGSRLAHLIPKDSADTAGPKPSDAPSWRPRQRTDTDPFASDSGPSGSALLSEARDNNSPPTTAAQTQRGGVFDTPVKGNAGDFGMAGLSLHTQGVGNGPASPSETNPYRSPPADRSEEGHGTQAGASSEQQSGFGTFPRSFGAGAFEGSDRSQTSSVGAKGLGLPLSGWPAGPSLGTPDRERGPFQNGFGASFYSPLTDLPSPGFPGLGGVFAPPSASRQGRGKLESLFPPAMQAQMHGHDQENLSDSIPDLSQANPLGAIGRSAIGLPPRETDSPQRPTRGGFQDLFPTSESSRTAFSTAEQAQPGLTSTAHSQSFPTTTGTASFPSTLSTAQPVGVRTMVMPDRMRWVYLDPQGMVQGPFSGLEMHDWYKANFFSPDLRVKRVEDPDFEPLGQLIRRIGNSREPFLVPQMGIPHGEDPQPGPFGSGSEAIPPLPQAFPSFGRTLTAQQQNELERRKQEEQMFQARQRELAQQHHHPFGGLPPIRPGLPGGLQHHSSAHSLQSQPSFGSMTSPIGMTSQHPLGPIAPAGGFFDTTAAMAPGPAQAPIGRAADIFAPDLNFSERQMLASLQATGGLPGVFPTSQTVGGPVGENSGLRSQLPTSDQLQKDPEGFRDRIQEFERLRAQHDAEEAAVASGAKAPNASQAKEDVAKQEERAGAATTSATQAAGTAKEAATTEAKKTSAQAEMTLTEKVRKTQADNAKPSQPSQPSGLPMPFPPPVQVTPLAAPTAQRPASNLPARYGERSAPGTPDTTSDAAVLAPPPTAPWASAEIQKGPSLKEIQEAEAKKAAKKEEAAAAARRAALEQEAAALREREKAAAAAANSGLPPHSTWGTGSPVGAPAGSPWKQPGALKAVGAGTANSGSKKTLAEIQREEELRKQKAKESASQASTPVPSAMGKRYADLAGKASAPPSLVSPAAAQANQGGGWATVGAGGKVKIPTGPAVQSRSTSMSKASPVPAVAKPAPKPAPTSLKDAKDAAMEEFKKWLHRELERGLNGVPDIEQFAAGLLEMPLEPSILAEAVYAYSTTMDGRHFGEEFVRRKKLADKGISEKVELPAGQSAGDGRHSSNGGWSEVAKKGGNSAAVPKDEIPGFRSGRYLDVLLSDQGSCLIDEFATSLFQTITPSQTGNGGGSNGHTTSTNGVVEGEAEEAGTVTKGKALLSPRDRTAVGLAALDAFLQANVTGPVLDERGVRNLQNRFLRAASAAASTSNITTSITARQLRRACVRTLEVDGVEVYEHVPHVELFALAKFIFTEVIEQTEREGKWRALRPSLGPGSVFNKSASWCDVPSLQDRIERGMAEVEREVVMDGETGEWSAVEKVRFLVEKANEALRRATEFSGFVFQEKSTSQLVVLAKSGEKIQTQNGGEGQGQAKPEALALNDDTLLENLEFTKEEGNGKDEAKSELPAPLRDLLPDEQPQLSPLDQIILLAEATLKDAFSPADTLTSEEVLPFAVRVIADKSTNWQIYTHALLVRSRIEVHRSRTIERGVLQMQAVVDQVIVDTTQPAAEATAQSNQDGTSPADRDETKKPANKPTSFFPAPKPTETAPAQVRLEWHLESELAHSWASVGSLVSALEIFKRLRLTAASDDEDGRGRGGEAKAKAVLRWRLFHKTGTSAEQQRGSDEADEDEEVDLDELKEADYHGPERQPPPPNAPRLWCILGDIENDPAHYERAWEISKHRFARAQKSLGEEAYKKAVAVNRLSSELWNRLGDISLRLGDAADATEAYQRAIAAANDVVGGEDARTWSNLGSALFSLYLERAQDLKQQKEKGTDKAETASQPQQPQQSHDDDEEEDYEPTEPKQLPHSQRDPSTLLSQALSAYKRGANIARDNWRIWDNVITLASRLRPPPVIDLLLGLRNVLRIRGTEDALDIDVVRLLVNEALLSQEQSKPSASTNVDDLPRGTEQRAVCEFLERSVVPVITVRSDLWELVTRERVWRGDYRGAVDAAERAWRAAMGGSLGGGALLPSSAAAASGNGNGNKKGDSNNWLEDREGWKTVVDRTDELVSMLENYGELVDEIGVKWKGKARSAVRSVMGKAKESWEGSEDWERLVGLLEGLR
ncbi:gyf domain-containing protein [Achaetomium macrosporum]|uniref:Gyf domain-containing protein n=1 Tax=Achaetomium macrosporum TaxID=79813 RepID=A0AAN7CBI3_9PEZI|nr:gyf domain-containing protein [Achaetomium macrosporum]